jgi:signal transduction histidine kinase
VVAVFVLSALSGGYAHNVLTSILFVVLFSVIAFGLGIVSWRRGNRSARLFVLATTAGLSGAIVTALTVSSLLPFTFFTYRAADFGMLLDAMLLSLALADRYKALEKERDALRLKEQQQEVVMLRQHQQAALGSMIGVIAHQLKQPLNAISLYVQGMVESFHYGELDGKSVDKTQANVWKNITFMADTIDDFRNYFRPDREKKVFAVRGVIEKTLSLLAQQLKMHEVQVDVACDPAICVEGFERELQQVVLTLVVNALDVFQEKSTENPAIDIKATQQEERVMLTVSDNGGGIPESALPHMFELYFTTKGEEGTGLGLYMSRMIVTESLGGEISVKNGERGARFTIWLPGRRCDD